MRHPRCDGMKFIHLHRATTRQNFSALDLLRDFAEKFRRWMRIGIHKNQPIARRGGGSAISRARNLVDWFENNFGSGGAGKFRGAVGGIVIADDEFGLPTETDETFHR